MCVCVSAVTDRWMEDGRGEAKRLDLQPLKSICVCLEESFVPPMLSLRL